MNWDQIEGNWKQFKGEAQAQWGKLTHDDWDVVQGNHQKLVGKLQERYGYAKEEAEREVDAFVQKH
ncbi:CsbD family protein [Pseudooceanicola sp. C21-150M6]|uniref:CsbD family protein n=1 Tax=Pseudooceanicola sp. C21-150M6 TaxID=3434355 RepID=UPI003D7F32A8